MEIAVVGSEEFVVGFRLAGVETGVRHHARQAAGDRREARWTRSMWAYSHVHTKDLERLPLQLRTRMMASVDPVVIPVGEEEGDMRDKVRRAIGIDLYKSK